MIQWTFIITVGSHAAGCHACTDRSHLEAGFMKECEVACNGELRKHRQNKKT